MAENKNVRRRQSKIEGKKDNWTYDQRANNISGHESMDLKARDEMIKRGVPKNTPNLPSANYKSSNNPSKYKKK